MKENSAFFSVVNVANAVEVDYWMYMSNSILAHVNPFVAADSLHIEYDNH